jgi:hypothetical protein
MSKEMALALREVAGPITRAEKVSSAIETVARRVGITYWRAFDIWYGKARRVTPDECAAIESALERKRNEAERNELHELKIRLAKLEARLATTDPDFHEQSIAGMRAAFAPAGARGSGRR